MVSLHMNPLTISVPACAACVQLSWHSIPGFSQLQVVWYSQWPATFHSFSFLSLSLHLHSLSPLPLPQAGTPVKDVELPDNPARKTLLLDKHADYIEAFERDKDDFVCTWESVYD